LAPRQNATRIFDGVDHAEFDGGVEVGAGRGRFAAPRRELAKVEIRLGPLAAPLRRREGRIGRNRAKIGFDQRAGPALTG